MPSFSELLLVLSVNECLYLQYGSPTVQKASKHSWQLSRLQDEASKRRPALFKD